MSKFVLLDHSLKDLGGHHFEYDVHILRAAEAAGFEPVLATYRAFEERHRLPAHWQVFPLFRYSSYLKYSVTVDPSHPPLNPFLPLVPPLEASSWGARLRPTELWNNLRNWRDRLRQRKRLNYFAWACDRLFQQVGLAPGDHVFAPTLSEFDLVGLVRFLKSCPAAREVDWHLQFHFPFLAGREPDYARQADRIKALREHFAGLLSTVAGYRLRFYSTTAQVAAQYNRLGVAEFELLPYPVNPSFRPTADGGVEPGRPLRVVCAGGVREEKGQHQLEHIVRELWPDYLAPGRLQLWIQAGPDGRLPEAPADPASGPPWGGGESASAAASRPSPILRVPHPLPLDEYAELVRTADIGLFLYDSERYYTRCSGILVEMLCSGVPVIVPAGCWLAEEIAEDIYRHLDQLAQSLPTLTVMAGRELQRAGQDGWAATDVPGGSGVTFARGSASLTTEVGVPERATEALVSFRWVRPQGAGSYLRLECEQLDRRGQSLGRFATIVGQRALNAAVPALFHLRAQVDRLRLRWENAYQDEPVTIADVNLRLLSTTTLPGRGCPAGSVGLIAADPFQIPELLRDMTEHYAHYRQSARQFSLGYGQLHDPRHALRQLLAGPVCAVADVPSGVVAGLCGPSACSWSFDTKQE